MTSWVSDIFIPLGKRRPAMTIVFFFLIFSITINPSSLLAQVHPGYENFKLSPKDEAELLFIRGLYKESIEKWKEIKVWIETEYPDVDVACIHPNEMRCFKEATLDQVVEN